MYLALTTALGSAFLLVKLDEYREHLRAGELPSSNTFFAIYYTLTGFHALHIAGGMVVMLYFLGPGAKLWAGNPEQFTNRMEATGSDRHFVDLVWILLFPCCI